MAIPISDVKRRVVYSGSAGVGPYSFSFEILAATDIAVYKDTTLLTLTTDYSVYINAADGTGHITLGTAATGDNNITIVGDRGIARTTDFVTGGDLFANSLNDELDSLTIFSQQVKETADRALKAPVTDPTDVNMTLPAKAARLGTVLGFNATTGDPEPGPVIADVSTLAAITADIATLADIEDGTDATDAIQTVAGISGNVTTVAGISANVTSVAGISSDVTTVAADGADIGTVAGSISNVNTTATNIADVNTVATNIASVNTVATSISDVITVANDLNEAVAEIDTVAGSIANVDAVGTDIANVNTVATNIANVNTVAGISSDVTTVAADGTDIGVVAGVSTDVTTVAGQISPTNNISTVAGVAANVATVAGISSDVTTVAGNSANVTTVAGISGNVTTVAGISADVTTVAADGTDIGTVATNIANVNTVAGISSNVTAVANDATDIGTVATDLTGSNTIGTVAGIAANVTTVAGISADVTTVAADGTDIGTVATNIADVNTVAGISANVTTVAGDSANISTLAGITSDISQVAFINADVTAVANDYIDIGVVSNDLFGPDNIGTVAGIAANVTTVAGISSDVTTVATNVTDVTNFADVYYGAAASDPSTRKDTSALQAGDLYFNTTDDVMHVYDGSAWEAVTELVTLTNTNTAASFYIPFASGSTTGDYALGIDSGFYYNPSANQVNATSFYAPYFYATDFIQLTGDNDYIVWGAGLDARMFYDGLNNTFEMELEAAATSFIITDNGTTRFTFEKSTGNFSTSGNVTAANLVTRTSATGSAALPSGTTAQRDGSPAAGYIRFNTTDSSFEGYDGSAWGAIGGGVGGTYNTYTAGATLAAFETALADTSGGAFTLTLPGSPTAGDVVIVGDASGNFATNNLTIARNGQTIQGSATDLVCNIDNVIIRLHYSGTDWRVYTILGATGGDVVTLTGTQTLTNKTLTSPTLSAPTINDYTEGTVAIGTVSTAHTFSLTNGTLQTATLTASTACTFTMPTAAAGKSFLLILNQAATTGNGTATFTGVLWAGGSAPTVTAAAGSVDMFSFVSDGTNWFGSTTQDFS